MSRAHAQEVGGHAAQDAEVARARATTCTYTVNLSLYPALVDLGCRRIGSGLWYLSAVQLPCHGVIPLVLIVTGAIGCEPTFKPNGSLMIQDRDFEPVACHVLVNCFGFVLQNAAGVRLEMRLPPAILNAWQSVRGVPEVRFVPSAGAPAVNLGACGMLTLTGQGYHGGGKRAASGHLSLSCSGGMVVKGDLTFSGCF